MYCSLFLFCPCTSLRADFSLWRWWYGTRLCVCVLYISSALFFSSNVLLLWRTAFFNNTVLLPFFSRNESKRMRWVRGSNSVSEDFVRLCEWGKNCQTTKNLVGVAEIFCFVSRVFFLLFFSLVGLWGSLILFERKRKTAATFYHVKPEKRKHAHTTTITTRWEAGKRTKSTARGKSSRNQSWRWKKAT